MHSGRRATNCRTLTAVGGFYIPTWFKAGFWICQFWPCDHSKPVRVATSFNLQHRMVQMDGYELGNDLVSCHFRILTNPLVFTSFDRTSGLPQGLLLRRKTRPWISGTCHFWQIVNVHWFRGPRGPIQRFPILICGFKSDRLYPGAPVFKLSTRCPQCRLGNTALCDC